MSKNRYPEYRLKTRLNFQYRGHNWVLKPGETCEYFAHSDTYLFEARDGVVPFFDGERVETAPLDFEPVNYFVLLGGMADFGRADGDSLLDCSPGDTVVWTCRKEAKRSDRTFIYIISPISAIVCAGRIIDELWLNTDTESRWKGYWMAEIGNLELLPPEKYVPMKNLRELFPDWKWLAFPRGNTRIPAYIIQPFMELIKQ